MAANGGCILLSAVLSEESGRIRAFDYVLSGVRELMLKSKFSFQENFINPHLLLDVLVHVQKDLNTFDGPDAFKIGGHLCFWMARLKPFRHVTQYHLYANETIALQVGLAIVRESHGPRSIDHATLANLLYDLRYGHSSPVSVSNHFQLLYCKGAPACL